MREKVSGFTERREASTPFGASREKLLEMRGYNRSRIGIFDMLFEGAVANMVRTFT